jgi:hypothetical protein
MGRKVREKVAGGNSRPSRGGRFRSRAVRELSRDDEEKHYMDPLMEITYSAKNAPYGIRVSLLQ